MGAYRGSRSDSTMLLQDTPISLFTRIRIVELCKDRRDETRTIDMHEITFRRVLALTGEFVFSNSVRLGLAGLDSGLSRLE